MFPNPMQCYKIIICLCFIFTTWFSRSRYVLIQPKQLVNFIIHNFVFRIRNFFHNSIDTFTYSSSSHVRFLKTLPFNAFMSLSFRRLRYLPYKTDQYFKMHKTFICLGSSITETFFFLTFSGQLRMFWNVSKSRHRRHRVKGCLC